MDTTGHDVDVIIDQVRAANPAVVVVQHSLPLESMMMVFGGSESPGKQKTFRSSPRPIIVPL